MENVKGDKMIFNFELFSKLAEREYRVIVTESCIDTDIWTLDEVLEVFRYYFFCYEKHFRRAHPPIRTPQITRIMKAMPYITDSRFEGYSVEIEPHFYKALIDRHFVTRYHKCDFRINHFFTKDVRVMRYRESLRF